MWPWHRRYHRLLRIMTECDSPMTVDMLQAQSGYNRPLVLHFRDWAKNTGRIESVEGKGTPIFYRLTDPAPDVSS